MDWVGAKAETEFREIQLNGGEALGPHLGSNYVHASKFTLLTFLPLTLREVLMRPSSVWFLAVILIETNAFGLSYARSYATLSLFCLHVFLTLLKAALTLQLYQQGERDFNNNLYEVWSQGSFKERKSAQIQVGDVLLIKEGGRFPADMVLLSSSSQYGTCYVNIQRIYGEGNLVTKQAVPPTFRFLRRSSSSPDYNLSRLQTVLKVQPPNADFSSFSGTIKLPSLPRTVPIKLDHFLTRGSTLRGEEWILAVVVYAGMETKFWSNVHFPSVRLSKLERKLDFWVVTVSGFLALVAGIHLLVQETEGWEPVKLEDFLLYLLVYSNVVPVALYVAMDLLRLVYAVQCRNTMKDASVSLNCNIEDLGEVEFVLADKTGTVTKNKLEFVAVLLGTQMYTKFPIFLPCKQDTVPLSDDEAVLQSETNSFGREAILSFQDLKQKMQVDYTEEFQRFCECVTLCNSVVIQKDNSMLATNTDEEALMKGAKELGFELINKGGDECDIDFFDMCHSYQVLCVKKFSPGVKRMRILVQQEIDDYATLYIKGAYAALRDMIKIPTEERQFLERRLRQMEQKGLRTMVLCYRKIEGEFLAEVRIRAKDAMAATLNKEGKLEVLLQELEQDLEFLGVTGVLDYTDDATAVAIAELGRAGISTWILSGEGEAHTLAAAYELDLIPPTTEVVSIHGFTSPSDCHKRLAQAVSDLLLAAQTEASALDVRFSLLLRDRMLQDNVNFALSIDGNSFESATKLKEARKLLLSLMLTATTVCFSSMSPGQKREVAKLIQVGMKSQPVALSIGDDVNDLPMLLETNLSVGIRGSAIDSSCDIRIPGFSHLARLILEDGRRLTMLANQTVRLFLYAQVLFAMAGLTMSFVGHYTPYCWTAIGDKAMYAAVYTFAPIFYLGFTNCSAAIAEPTVSEQDILVQSSFRFSLHSAIRCVFQSIFHFAAIAAFVFPALYVGSSTEVSYDDLSFILQLTMVLAVNIECFWSAVRVTPGLISIELASVALLVAYTYGQEGAETTLVVVFSTPRLILAVIAAGLCCFVLSSTAFYQNFLSELRPLLKSAGKVYPFRLQASEIRKIKRSNTIAMLQVFSKKNEAESQIKANFDINCKSAVFKGYNMESEFQRTFLEANYTLLLIVTAILCAMALFPMVFELADDLDQVEIAYKAAIFAAILALIVLFSLKNLILLLSWTFCLAIITVVFILNLAMDYLSALIYFYATVYMLIFIREKWNCALGISTLASAFLILASGLNIRLHDRAVSFNDGVDLLGTIFVQTLSHVLSARLSHRRSLQHRHDFKLIKQSEERIVESDRILSCLLPDFVRKQVKDGIRYIAEDKGQVSVIFIDICHFDQICAKYAPQELTALMDDIFQKIDEMCTSLYVAKIETVGKTYLACAGLRDFEFESTGEYIAIPHAKRCIDLAFAILSSFRNYKLQSEQSLSFKIGINSGEVIAGVVGFHKPQFSLVGDTVNTGSRMSTTLETPNSVQVSESTYRLISHVPDYQFEPRKIPVKGKGEMQTFIVRQTPFNKRGAMTIIDTVEEVAPAHVRQQQRSSVRTSLLSLDLNEIYARNEKELIERVSFFAWKTDKMEHIFRLDVLFREFDTTRFGLLLYSLCLFGLFAARIGIFAYHRDGGLGGSPLYLILSMCAGIAVVWLNRLLKRREFPWMLIGMYAATSIGLSLDSILTDGFQMNFPSLVHGFLCVLIYHYSGLFFRHAVIATVTVIVPHTVIWMFHSTEMRECAVSILLFALQNCVFLYFSERNQRTFYTTSKAAEKEIEKTEQLLTQMIPVHAYESLKNEQWSTDKLQDVSILFADISGFTAWSSRHTPQEVIGKLGKIFTLFDKICVRKRMCKVHTIGDCYVALSSTSNKENRDVRDECARMVSFALEMVNVVDEICREDNEQLKMRIGVHVGEVIGGITGSGIVRYDIYGPDVLVANKMESNGKEGRVNVSVQTKALLEQTEEFVFEFNKRVEVKEVERSTDAFFVGSK